MAKAGTRPTARACSLRLGKWNTRARPRLTAPHKSWKPRKGPRPSTGPGSRPKLADKSSPSPPTSQCTSSQRFVRGVFTKGTSESGVRHGSTRQSPRGLMGSDLLVPLNVILVLSGAGFYFTPLSALHFPLLCAHLLLFYLMAFSVSLCRAYKTQRKRCASFAKPKPPASSAAATTLTPSPCGSTAPWRRSECTPEAWRASDLSACFA